MLWLIRAECADAGYTQRMFRFTFAALVVMSAAALQAQFTMQDSGTTADLRGIVNVGNGTAWASGTHGTVLRTEDSGFVWQGCTVPPGAEKLDFRGIQAFDDQTAIVMSSGRGDLSRVYKTTDGCATWKLVFTNPDADGFFDGVQVKFTNRDAIGKQVDGKHAHGFLLGDPVGGIFPIFETGDSGDTWIRRESYKAQGAPAGCKVDQFQAQQGEAAFAASNQALLDGTEGPIFVTGGSVTRIAYATEFGLDGSLCHRIAHQVGLPIGAANASSGSFAVAPAFVIPVGAQNRPEARLVIVGGDYAHPDQRAKVAASITKLDSSFRQVKLAETQPHGYRSSVAYDVATKKWITVGPNGTDVSTDDGLNWRALKPGYGDDPNADKQWNALSLPYVVGPHGRIGRLRDDALADAKQPR